jgi:hypothetical protein
MDEAENQRSIERALRRALESFRGNYGTTEARIELNPSTGTFDPVTGQASSGCLIVNWPGECNPPRRDMAISFTVQADYEVQDAFGGPTPADNIDGVFLQYEWGDLNHMAQVDLVRGHPVSLAGSRLTVHGFYPRIIQQNPAIFQPKIWIKVSVGPGSSDAAPGITGSAHRTIDYGIIGPNGDSPIFAIPPWAVAAVLVNPSVALPTVVYTQFKDPFGVNADSPISQVDLGKLNGFSVPIAHPARFARVHNPSAVAQRIRILYFLGIGA